MQQTYGHSGLEPRSNLQMTFRKIVDFWRVGELQRTQSLLSLRFSLLNLTGFALLAMAWVSGWIQPLFTGSSTVMVALIGAVFLLGLLWCTRLVFDTGRELDQVKSERPDPQSRAGAFLAKARVSNEEQRAAAAAALRLKLTARLSGVRHLAGSLVFLGLIGTVVGFMIALDGIDPSQAADASAIAPMVANLIDGMGLALTTTLVGAVLNLWLMADYRILEHGTGKLVAELIERGAEHGRS